MYKKRIISLLLLSIFVGLSVLCPIGHSEATVLTFDDLPGVGESLVIESDSVLTVDKGETATIEGALSIN
jgi:hypothetical protein